jgi:hypothetical protein
VSTEVSTNLARFSFLLGDDNGAQHFGPDERTTPETAAARPRPRAGRRTAHQRVASHEPAVIPNSLPAV